LQLTGEAFAGARRKLSRPGTLLFAGQLTDNSTANSLDPFAQVVAAQPGTVQAITENGDHGATEAQQELVRASQGMAAKPMAASPFDSPPLQQVIRLEVNELVE
jgi:hypothetical protein